jgi:hypothetical protein
MNLLLRVECGIDASGFAEWIENDFLVVKPGCRITVVYDSDEIIDAVGSVIFFQMIHQGGK